MVEQAKYFSRLSALRNENGDVRLADDAQIAVNAVGRVKKRRGCARRRKCCSNLSPDESGLPDSGDDDATFGSRDALHRAREFVADPALCFAERLGLHAKHPTSTLDDVLVRHRLMR